MKLSETYFNRAEDVAAMRGVLPSSLGSAEQRRRFSTSLKRAMVFSAKTAHADYLTDVYNEIQAILKGGYENDVAAARLRLKQRLAHYGYTAETGFPGDDQLGIEPAEPGSLSDLSADVRLNLIIETQTGLMRGAISNAQDLEPNAAAMFPWWELVRKEQRRVPRGSPDSGSLGWPARWLEAAGPAPVTYGNQTRLIAPKDHHVWRNLGDSSIFDDALDVDHPPFAFRSGWGVRNIHWREGREMGLDLPDYAKPRSLQKMPANVIEFPAPKASVKRIAKPVLAEMKAALAESLGSEPILSTTDILRMSKGGQN